MRRVESDCLVSCSLVEADSSNREGGEGESLLPVEDAHRPPKRGERSRENCSLVTKVLGVAMSSSMGIARRGLERSLDHVLEIR